MSTSDANNAVLSGQMLQALVLQVGPQQVARLRALGRQTRTHSEAQIKALAESLQRFGFLVPLIIDEQGRVLAGMGRLRAAKLLGMGEVPCIVVTHLTPELKRAFVLAENRLAELAGWDRDILSAELGELKALDLGFELTELGWSDIQIDHLVRPIFDGDRDEEPARPLRPASRLGDHYQLGDHRLFCGDALQNSSFRTLMMGETARVCITDPPFNLKVADLVTTALRLREFPMASGEMTDEQFCEFLVEVLKQICAQLISGGLLYVAMDWRHMWHLLSAARALSLQHINLCVWNKGRGGMGSYYRSQHELFSVFKSGEGAFLNRVELGRHGRDRSNVWDYPGATGARPKDGEEAVAHATPKNVEMLCDALKDCTERGDLVLDPFGGGGSLLMAAERTSRRARMMELDPVYVDVMIERWQRFTGRQAVLLSTGQSFAEVAAERAQATTPAPIRIRHRTSPPASAPPVRVRSRTMPAAPAPPVRIRHRSFTARVEG